MFDSVSSGDQILLKLSELQSRGLMLVQSEACGAHGESVYVQDFVGPLVEGSEVLESEPFSQRVLLQTLGGFRPALPQAHPVRAVPVLEDQSHGARAGQVQDQGLTGTFELNRRVLEHK